MNEVQISNLMCQFVKISLTGEGVIFGGKTQNLLNESHTFEEKTGKKSKKKRIIHSIWTNVDTESKLQH